MNNSIDTVESAIESLETLTDGELHMAEVRARHLLQAQINEAKEALKNISRDIRAHALRLKMEANLLSDEEARAIRGEISALIAQRRLYEWRVENLPGRMKLYRALGRPEATIQIGRMIHR